MFFGRPFGSIVKVNVPELLVQRRDQAAGWNSFTVSFAIVEATMICTMILWVLWILFVYKIKWLGSSDISEWGENKKIRNLFLVETASVGRYGELATTKYSQWGNLWPPLVRWGSLWPLHIHWGNLWSLSTLWTLGHYLRIVTLTWYRYSEYNVKNLAVLVLQRTFE